MISHDIIVVKEQTFPVVEYSRGRYANDAFPQITCEWDFKVWLEATPFMVGDYVTYVKPPITFANFHAGTVYTITDKCKSFDEMETTQYQPYHPLLVQLTPLPDANGAPHMRGSEWRDIKWLRRLSEEELDTFVRPYLDRIRHHSQA